MRQTMPYKDNAAVGIILASAKVTSMNQANPVETAMMQIVDVLFDSAHFPQVVALHAIRKTGLANFLPALLRSMPIYGKDYLVENSNGRQLRRRIYPNEQIIGYARENQTRSQVSQ